MNFLQKISTFFALLTLFSVNCFTQDFKKQFEMALDSDDTKTQYLVLQNWSKAKPDDADLFISYFNYYINKSRNGGLAVSNNLSGNFINNKQTFDEENFKIGFEYINKGIQKHPNRLDMRFGKTYILGEKREYKSFTEEIVKIIDYSNVNKNQWTWIDNKPIENPQRFMLDSIQEYIIQLFDEGREYYINIKTIAETVLKYYPDSVENLTNISLFYSSKGEYDKALLFLLKAEKLAPQDAVVLLNIAECYYGKNEKFKAFKYLNLVIQHGNDDQQKRAKETIKELNIFN